MKSFRRVSILPALFAVSLALSACGSKAGPSGPEIRVLYPRRVAGATRTDAASGYAQGDETGTYTLDGYTLTLKAADGKTTRCTVFVEVKGANESKPEITACDGQKMGRARS